MATPTYVGHGTATASLTSVSPSWPAGHRADDIGFLLVQTDRNTGGSSLTPFSVTAPVGWTLVTNGERGSSGTGVNSNRIQVFYKVATSTSEASPLVVTPVGNNHVHAVIFAIRGVDTASPFSGTTVNSGNGPGFAICTFAAVVSAGAGTLVVGCATATNPSTPLGSITHSSGYVVTKRLEDSTTLGDDSALAVLTWVNPVAGNTGSITSFWAGANTSNSVTFALTIGPPPAIVDPPTFDFRPIRDGYTNDLSAGLLEIPLHGGMSKKIRSSVNPGYVVNCSWLLKSSEYSEFMGFFRTDISNGTESFLINVITDIGIPTRHRVRVKGGGPRLTRQSGDAYWVSCTLECEKNPTTTGNIIYTESGTIAFATVNPTLTYGFSDGDLVRVVNSKGVHPTGNTPLNLDGTYLIASVSGSDILILEQPEFFNSGWTTLAGLGVAMTYGDVGNGNVISTITKVPT